ncbi:hypothetical protein [Ancylobacter lacus]|uniref:hypothetical protein n=1 Tax=Ancylobacter lacus TaxID=2579970 RepID=UPI001BCF47ED|nr:hypothetical protein [Ancylobacter lacus]MBS7540757.1 hypothetical protein [Ancylobacter lacus]
MRRLLASLGLLLACAGAAHWVVPMGRFALDRVMAREDAARIADLALDRELTAPRVAAEIDAALADGDGELAASFLALADDRHVAVDPAQRARVAAGSGGAAAALRGAGSFGRGLVTGTADDLPGLAGAVAGDLTVWGDLRDGGRQVLNWARGEEVDDLILGLSAAGIAATGVTYATLGASLPMRAGLSVLKGARRAGLMSARLTADVVRGLRPAAPAAARLGGAAADGAGASRLAARGTARGTVSLAALAGDLGAAQGKAGTRATLLGLRHLDGAGDAARLRRLAEVKGGQTLAILKTLGRGALVVTEAMAKLALWLIAAAFNLLGLVTAFNGFVVEMLRPLWRRRGRRHGRPRGRDAVPGLGPAGVPYRAAAAM